MSNLGVFLVNVTCWFNAGTALGMLAHNWDNVGPASHLRLLPVDMKKQTNVGLMLGHRLRRWPNIEPTVEEIFSGIKVVLINGGLAYNSSAQR